MTPTIQLSLSLMRSALRLRSSRLSRQTARSQAARLDARWAGMVPAGRWIRGAI